MRATPLPALTWNQPCPPLLGIQRLQRAALHLDRVTRAAQRAGVVVRYTDDAWLWRHFTGLAPAVPRPAAYPIALARAALPDMPPALYLARRTLERTTAWWPWPFLVLVDEASAALLALHTHTVVRLSLEERTRVQVLTWHRWPTIQRALSTRTYHVAYRPLPLAPIPPRRPGPDPTWRRSIAHADASWRVAGAWQAATHPRIHAALAREAICWEDTQPILPAVRPAAAS